MCASPETCQPESNCTIIKSLRLASPFLAAAYLTPSLTTCDAAENPLDETSISCSKFSIVFSDDGKLIFRSPGSCVRFSVHACVVHVCGGGRG